MRSRKQKANNENIRELVREKRAQMHDGIADDNTMHALAVARILNDLEASGTLGSAVIECVRSCLCKREVDTSSLKASRFFAIEEAVDNLTLDQVNKQSQELEQIYKYNVQQFFSTQNAETLVPFIADRTAEHTIRKLVANLLAFMFHKTLPDALIDHKSSSTLEGIVQEQQNTMLVENETSWHKRQKLNSELDSIDRSIRTINGIDFDD